MSQKISSERLESDVRSYMYFLTRRLEMLKAKQNGTKEVKVFEHLSTEIVAYSDCIKVFAAMVGLSSEIRNLSKS